MNEINTVSVMITVEKSTTGYQVCIGDYVYNMYSSKQAANQVRKQLLKGELDMPVWATEVPSGGNRLC